MARKSRKNTVPITEQKPAASTRYHAALYARISVENEQKREADTIGNQITLLRDFVSQQSDLKAFDVYCDDDITGVSFQRPEFSRMMNDIRGGRVNCVIVKDFSRLGRNMLESGEYIEQIFPRMNVRFISVTDHFDSLRGDADISVQLKNFANEMYARDISKKIRSVKRSQQEAGMWTTGMPRYGYLMDPERKGHLIPDPEAAPVVLSIYRLFSEGNTMRFIANTLNEQRIPSPGRRLYDRGIQKADKYKNAIWYMGTIKNILTDPVYLGWVVCRKYRSQLFETGTKSSVKLPEDEWLVHKGMHEPLVPKALFDQVQEMMAARKEDLGLVSQYDSKAKRSSAFKGILRCGECGRGMTLRSKGERGARYICPIHESYRAAMCPKKSVPQEVVESLALRLIQSQIKTFIDARKIVSDLNATRSSRTKLQVYELQIADALRRIDKYAELKASLYGDFADGILSHDDYLQMSKDYETKADDLRIFIAEMEKEKRKYSEDYGAHTKWAELIAQYENRTTIDQEMASAFLESMTLYNDGHAEVVFKYRDELDTVILMAAVRAKESERLG